MKSILLLFLSLVFYFAGAQGSGPYLTKITKYSEKSVFADDRYKNMDWKTFYKLEEANDLVQTTNYDFALMNAAMFFAINKYRAGKGLAPLTFDPKLRDAASIHSDQMVKNNFFDHINSKDPKISSPNNRIELCGFKGQRIAENIAKSFMDPMNPLPYTELADKIVMELSLSKAHNKHMLDPDLTKAGCGFLFESSLTKNMLYFRLTQDFGADL